MFSSYKILAALKTVHVTQTYIFFLQVVYLSILHIAYNWQTCTSGLTINWEDYPLSLRRLRNVGKHWDKIHQVV